MTWGVYAALTPPLLMAGDVVQFATRETLAALIEPELSQHRLLCINLGSLPLNVERLLKLRVQGVSGEVAVRGRGVYHQSDLVGLQVECEPAIVLALKALAGPQALANVRRAAALKAEAEAAAKAASEAPAPLPPAPEPATPPPDPALLTPPPEPEPEPDPEPLTPAPEPPEPAPLGDFDIDFEIDAAELPTLVPGDVLDLESDIELPSSPSLVPVATEGLWVEPTRVEEPWELGGRLVQRTEPPLAPGVAGEARADTGPLPRIASQAPEMAGEPETSRLHGAPALGAFIGIGAANTLFRWVADQARKPRSGRASLSGAGRAFELAFDGRGGVISFTGMAAAPPEHDASELKSERRRRLAEALLPLGERAHLEAVLTPERPALRPGEKPVPLVDVLLQWIDLALTPVGSEPATQHYHRHLFHYPQLRATSDWGPNRLPLDRLQGRFVEESLTSGRPLQDILAFSPLGRPRTWRMLVLLDALGMLTFETEPPAAGRQGALHELLDALRLRSAQGRESHFSALGVHFASHPDEFAGALTRIVAKYGPGSPVAQGNTETRKLGEEIVTRAREAAAFLADRGRRQTYRATILTPMELRAAVDLLIGQYKLATMRKLPELSQQLADVIEELEPGALAAATQG